MHLPRRAEQDLSTLVGAELPDEQSGELAVLAAIGRETVQVDAKWDDRRLAVGTDLGSVAERRADDLVGAIRQAVVGGVVDAIEQIDRTDLNIAVVGVDE